MKHRGFTLIELMIALTIAMIILGTVITVSVSSKDLYRYTKNMSRNQEHGRFAMYFISEDIRKAKYGDCNPSTVVNHLHDPDAYHQPGVGVTGSEYVGTGGSNPATDWDPPLPSFFNSGEVVPGTDVLFISKFSDILYKVGPPWMPTPGGALHIEEPHQGITPDDIFMVTDCKTGDIFQAVGSNNPSTSGTLEHGTGNNGFPGNATKNFQVTYGAGSEIIKFTAHYYFIGHGTDGQPALFRMALKGGWGPEEMVGNIDDLQLLYGQDTTGDKAVDEYVTGDLVGNWLNTRAVHVELQAATPEKIVRETRDRRRQRFTSVVQIREFRK